MLWKIHFQVDQGQVTRSRPSSDLISEKVRILVIATATDRSHRNFQRLIWVTVCIKCISRNFDINDLRSSEFGTLSDLLICNITFPVRSWPRPSVIFSEWLFRLNYNSNCLLTREEQDAGKMNTVPFFASKVMNEKHFRRKTLFLEFFPSAVKTLPPFLRHCPKFKSSFCAESVTKVIECTFLRRCSSSDPKLCCGVEKCWNRQHLTFGDLWWLDLSSEPKDK